MKHQLLTLFLLLAAGPAAFAWPFVDNFTGVSVSSPHRMEPMAFQADSDRPLEFFGGGGEVLQMSANAQGLSAQKILLPAPDKDPYQQVGNASITFVSGRGDVGDIDGDGDLDIVYSSTLAYNGGEEDYNVRIVVCRNDGNNTWTRIWQLKDTQAPTQYAPEVKLADLDGDGDLDLIETHSGVNIYWNPGNGVYNGTPKFLQSPLPVTPELEVADFDGNGWPDIAVFGSVQGLDAAHPNWITGRLYLLSNTGGVFTGAINRTLTTLDTFQRTLAKDLDGDGRPDLIWARHLSLNSGNSEYSELVWQRNTGSGFAAPVLLFTAGVSGGVGAEATFAPGDLDGDGIMDLIVSGQPSEVLWLRGSGGGNFLAPVNLRSGGGGITGSIFSVADMDGDGDEDLVLSYGAHIMENMSIHQKASATVEKLSGTQPSGGVDLTVADLNHDGKDDLIAADGGGKRILWYSGNGNGLSLQLPVSTGGIAPASVVTADFNRDGWTDLAWTTTNTLTQALSTSGNGLFWSVSTAANMTGITSIQAADMDRDGDTDILAIAPASGQIRIHSNNGTATSWLPQTVATGLSGLSKVAVGSITPGGRPEIAALAGTSVNSYRYDTSWNSVPMDYSSGGTTSKAVTTGNVWGSSPGDEVVYALNSNTIYLKNDALVTSVAVGAAMGSVRQLAATDWNKDGYTDILAATTSGVFLYEQMANGTNTFKPALTLVGSPNMQDMVVMNLNGDSFPDAAVVDISGQIRLITNTSAAVELQIIPGNPLNLLQGGSGLVTTVIGTHNGVESDEPKAAPAYVRMRFLRSALVSGVDTPNTPMTDAEVAQLVEEIQFITNGTTVATTTPSGLQLGQYIFYLSEIARYQLAIGVGNTAQFQMKIKLKSTAASAAVKRFFVEYSPASAWVPFNATSAKSGPAGIRIHPGPEIPQTLVTVRAPSPLDTWRMTWFGTYDASGDAANDADPNGDGNANLVEYIMNRNPLVAGGIGSSQAVGLTSQGPNAPLLADLRLLDSYDSRVRLTLQQSTNLTSWTTLSTRTGTGAWSGAAPATVTLSGGRTRFNFTTGAIPASTPKYFLRLVAEEMP